VRGHPTGQDFKRNTCEVGKKTALVINSKTKAKPDSLLEKPGHSVELLSVIEFASIISTFVFQLKTGKSPRKPGQLALGLNFNAKFTAKRASP
jgi:hypothetical protein